MLSTFGKTYSATSNSASPFDPFGPLVWETFHFTFIEINLLNKMIENLNFIFHLPCSGSWGSQEVKIKSRFFLEKLIKKYWVSTAKGHGWHVLLRRHLNRMNRELVGPMVKRLRTIQENFKVKKLQLQRPNVTRWPVHIYINIAQPFRVGVLFQGNPVPASCLSSAWFAHHLDSAKKD